MSNKFHKYDLYMGLNDKDTKVQMIPTDEAYKIVYNQVAQRFDGGTVSKAEGIYKHDDKSVVVENTIKVELILFDKSKSKNDVKNFVDYLKVTFNQESIAVQHSMVDSQLW